MGRSLLDVLCLSVIAAMVALCVLGLLWAGAHVFNWFMLAIHYN